MTCLPGASHPGVPVLTWCSEAGNSEESPPLFLPRTTHKLMWQEIMHTRTVQCSGMVLFNPSYFLWGLDTKQWHTTLSCPPPPPLSVNKQCLRYWARECGLKRDVSHLSTAIMLPISRDIFISTGRHVRLDWAESCALMGRDNRLSGVRSHPRYTSHPFSLGVSRSGWHIFYWTSTHNLFQMRGLPSKCDSLHREMGAGRRLSGCMVTSLEKTQPQTSKWFR